VRYFTMGANRWQESDSWPPEGATPTAFYLAPGGRLLREPDSAGAPSSRFVSDPENPVPDPYDAYGPHDYSGLAGRPDLLVFDSAPFEQDTEFTGNVVAEIYASCDCRDFDLWVKLLRVDAQGHAWSLVNPGSDALRASYRDPSRRELLEPGKVYPLRLTRMLTSQQFKAGERLRLLVSASFFPRLSRNLQGGDTEAEGSSSTVSDIGIHHDAVHASRFLLPASH
jgi:putative CocE/NonD family hydrolase